MLTSDPKARNTDRRVYAIKRLPEFFTPAQKLRQQTDAIVRAQVKRDRKNAKRLADSTLPLVSTRTLTRDSAGGLQP